MICSVSLMAARELPSTYCQGVTVLHGLSWPSDHTSMEMTASHILSPLPLTDSAATWLDSDTLEGLEDQSKLTSEVSGHGSSFPAWSRSGKGGP
jgi:hypothetical protein